MNIDINIDVIEREHLCNQMLLKIQDGKEEKSLQVWIIQEAAWTRREERIL